MYIYVHTYIYLWGGDTHLIANLAMSVKSCLSWNVWTTPTACSSAWCVWGKI